MAEAGSDQRFPLFPLLVISGAIFASVSSEFLPTGLLPQIGHELHVSVSQVGLLVTVFATTVVISAAPLAALTHRFPRKWLMVAALGVVAAANLLGALAPNYAVLAGSRVLGGLAHGVFWSVTGPYASRIVARRQLSRAMAVTQAGGTAAFVLGVPVGTALGHALGWRLAFATMGVVVLVLLLLVVVALPHVEHLVPLSTGEIAVPLRRDRTVPAIVIVCVTILLVTLGQNVFYTYIVPWSTEVGAVPAGEVSGLLFLYGAAGAIGLLLSGLVGDRFPRGAVLAMAGGVAVAVAALAVLAPRSPGQVVLWLVLWSIAFGGIPSMLQTRMMHSVTVRMRDVAASWTTISFNISIGGGALFGGLLLDRLGIAVLPWAEVALVAAGIAFVLLTDRRRNALHPDSHRG